MAHEQLEIPLPDMTWSIKRILHFIPTKKVENLLDLNSEHTRREIIYIEHNYFDEVSTSDSSL